jgi:tripartite-type tricarboxylate transporter receptor subunit TctC
MKRAKSMTIILGVVSLAIVAWAVPSLAEYPEKPVQILVGYPAGGPADLSARALAEAAKPFFPKPIVVVNKPGGSGVLATNEVIRSAPDGYTLGHVSISHMCFAPNLEPDLPYKGPQDVQFVISCVTAQESITVREDSPWKTMRELIDYAKAYPGKVRLGNAGLGTTTHFDPLSMRLAGITGFTDVPFAGAAPAVTAILGGHIEAVSLNTSAVSPHIMAGKLRNLALFAEERNLSVPELKDVPTFKELGYNVITIGTPYYIAAPKKTPQKIVETLYEALLKAQKSDMYQKFCRDNLLVAEMKGPAQLTAEMEKNFAYYRDFIEKMNIRTMMQNK